MILSLGDLLKGKEKKEENQTRQSEPNKQEILDLEERTVINPTIVTKTFDYAAFLAFMIHQNPTPAQMYSLAISPHDAQILLSYFEDEGLTEIQRSGSEVIMSPEAQEGFYYFAACHIGIKGKGIILIEGDQRLKNAELFFQVASILKIWMRQWGNTSVCFAHNVGQPWTWYAQIAGMVVKKEKFATIDSSYLAPRITPDGGLLFIKDDGANEIYYLAPEYVDPDNLDLTRARLIHHHDDDEVFLLGLSRIGEDNNIVVVSAENLEIDLDLAPVFTGTGNAIVIAKRPKIWKGIFMGVIPGYDIGAWVQANPVVGKVEAQVTFAQIPSAQIPSAQVTG